MANLHEAGCSLPLHEGERPGRTLPLHDRERLGVLLAGLEPRLEAVALRITRHPDSARDVVQNAFEKVLRHGGQFLGQALVSTWMHRIVANEALMWLRAQRRRAECQCESESEASASGELPDAAPGPAEQLHLQQRAARLHAGLARLPAGERDLMLRCGLAEETYADYGRRTGAHPAAVKSRAFRARQRLARELREQAV